jgi:threonine synthase
VKPGLWNPALLGFECGSCGHPTPPEDLAPVCPRCGKPLVARYDLAAIARRLGRDQLGTQGPGLWRYAPVLPFGPGIEPARLGEGGTPLIPLPGLAGRLGVREVWLKEESGNATQSFKARGLALALNAAAATGRRRIALPSAGNAGSAAAAYAAALGLECRITVPEDTPETFILEQRGLGAEVRLVPGTISDAGATLASFAPAPEWWNVATFKEPFRLEGKKTLAYEIAEASGWRPPEVVFYPTGGGTGLVGMWRGFAELLELGWIEGRPPRLIAVQPEGCAPVVRAFETGEEGIAPWPDARTRASGLRVPAPFAERLILKSLRETGGTALAVSEDEMLDGMVDLSGAAGVFACPEGGATLAALRRLREQGRVTREDRVVIFNTGSGLKYPDVWRAALERRGARDASDGPDRWRRGHAASVAGQP